MKAKRSKFSDEVRRAVLDASVSRYRLWQLTGVPQATLSRFVRGQAGISLDALDKLADVLDLHITTKRGK